MTELHQSLLDFIHRRVAEGGAMPSTRELQRAFRYRNETVVLRALESLAAEELLSRRGDAWGLKTPSVQLSLGLPTDADPSNR